MAALTRRGRFITLEGGEGAGKSSHLASLREWLAGQGVPVLATREPGGSPRAETLRKMLLSGRFAGHGPEAEAMAFALARADHMAVTVRPALAGGTWVISDRFMDSTHAYQGAAGVDPAFLDLLDAIAVGAERPDLTLVLDLSAELGLRRTQSRADGPDRFERDALEVQEARRRIFLRIAADDPGRCVVIDASAEKSEVQQAIRAAIAARLPLPAGAG
jgi:dTMP kinase